MRIGGSGGGQSGVDGSAIVVVTVEECETNVEK